MDVRKWVVLVGESLIIFVLFDLKSPIVGGEKPVLRWGALALYESSALRPNDLVFCTYWNHRHQPVSRAKVRVFGCHAVKAE